MVPASAIGKPSADKLATALWIGILHQVMKGTDTNAPPAPTSAQHTDAAAGPEHAGLAGQRARRFGFAIQEHLRGRERHKHREQITQQAQRQRSGYLRSRKRADQNAGRQLTCHRPEYDSALVMRTHRGERCETDGCKRGGDCHLDGAGLPKTPCEQDQGQDRQHQHAASQSQQAGQETGAQARKGQFEIRERVKDRKRIRCLQVPPDRHPEPGFRWARAAPASGSSDARRSHQPGNVPSPALGALVQGNIQPDEHRRHLHCNVERGGFARFLR